jgi:ABC-type spermidine/putrescine transport system permease subunit II
MDTQMLVALEEAIEPYRRAGFIITSQSEGAITLIHPRAKFSYLLFIVLLLVWPLAILYLISFNNKGEKRVCLRVTSQGQIEASGYTLAVIERDRKRERLVHSIILVILVIVIIVWIFVILHFTGNL